MNNSKRHIIERVFFFICWEHETYCRRNDYNTEVNEWLFILRENKNSCPLAWTDICEMPLFTANLHVIEILKVLGSDNNGAALYPDKSAWSNGLRTK